MVYEIPIQFGSDPERVEELTKVIFQEIENLKTKGSSQVEVNDVKEALYRSYETGMKQNNWLLTQLSYKYRLGEDPSDLLIYRETLDLLTPDVIQEAARKYFNVKNYVQVSLYPEEKDKDISFWPWLPLMDIARQPL